MGDPTLGQRASFGSKNDRSRVMASQFAPGEEQLCENPRYSLGSFQSCLPSWTLWPQPDPSSSTECEAAHYAKCADTRWNKGAHKWPGFTWANASAPCGLHRAATERVVRIEVGRHQLCSRHNERHALHRVWSGRTLQNWIFTEAGAGSSHSLGCTGEMERSLPLQTIGFLQTGVTAAESRYGVRQSCANTFAPSRRMLESRNDSDGILSGTRTRLCCEVWGRSSRLCRSCCGIRPSGRCWMSTRRESRRRSTPRRPR